MAWISRVLPLDTFSEICRKVYFAVEDYSEIDFILNNGYLQYVFHEYTSATGLQVYLEHRKTCERNLQNACARLPILLTPSIEVIAALTLGVRDITTSTLSCPSLTSSIGLSCSGKL